MEGKARNAKDGGGDQKQRARFRVDLRWAVVSYWTVAKRPLSRLVMQSNAIVRMIIGRDIENKDRNDASTYPKLGQKRPQCLAVVGSKQDLLSSAAPVSDMEQRLQAFKVKTGDQG